MDVYPAIDLRNGHCVRLAQGDYERETRYEHDPVAVARGFAAAGAPWVHIVDLDAARTGRPVNRQVVAAVAGAVDVPVESGGGVRDIASAEQLFDVGVSRVVVGTAAVEKPGLVKELAGRHPGQVAVGLDHRLVRGRREVAVRGWTEGSGLSVADALRRLEDAGASVVIVTDIGRDGMLTGPDLDGLAEVAALTSMGVIASGGVSSADDLLALAALDAGGRGLAGAIVGRALYEGKLTVEEAVAACAR